jgi:4-hydroxy-3-methylbut-2-enyl diphosphate reductase
MRLILAKPRGFCAGVVRAIAIVEKAIQRFGAPIYVFHEIVHNRHVIEDLLGKGAIFVEDLEMVPEGSYLIYSAHGTSPDVRKQAQKKKLIQIDATCPLVTRNHSAVKRFAKMGASVLLIGHKKHVEVVATAAESIDAVTIIESLKDVEKLSFPPNEKLFYLTQTTLSVDEVQEIVFALREKFPFIRTHSETSICYATTNRQMAMKSILGQADLALVVGDPKSSNSNRLKEISLKANIPSYLVNDPKDLKKEWMQGVSCIAMTAGASTPEHVVKKVIEGLYSMGLSSVEEVCFQEEKVSFSIPPILLSKSGFPIVS